MEKKNNWHRDKTICNNPGEDSEYDNQFILEKRGIFFINGTLKNKNLTPILTKIWNLDHDPSFTDDIKLIINSPGGYTSTGWGFIDAISSIKSRVTTLALGCVESMAAAIFIAGDERIMSPNSYALIHQFWESKEGNYSALISSRKGEDMEHERHIRHLINNSKYKTREQIEKKILFKHDHYISPEEMKRHGLCDKVLKIKKR